MQDSSRGQLVKAIITGFGGRCGLAASRCFGLLGLVGGSSLVEGIPRGTSIVAMIGFVAIGYIAGEAVRRVVGYKLDKRFQYTAGLSVFGAYLVTLLVVLQSFTPGNVFFLNNIVALAGMGVGIWIAMARVRP